MKYEILKDETIEFGGKTLYRIKALKTLPGVNIGDKGGYIEGPDNLSQTGKCWIGTHAKVCGKARVRNNALVTGPSYIKDEVTICDDAQVYSSKISGRCVVEDRAVISFAKLEDDVVVKQRGRVGEGSVVKGYSTISDWADVKRSLLVHAHLTDSVSVSNSEVTSRTLTDHLNIHEGIIDVYHNFLFMKGEGKGVSFYFDKDGKLRISIGCQRGITPEKLKYRIKHDDTLYNENTPHRKEYLEFLKLAQKMLKI